MDDDVPKVPEVFCLSEYPDPEHKPLKTTVMMINWFKKWLVPVEECPGQIYPMIRMVRALLTHYFPEEKGWEVVMGDYGEEVVIYTVKCHDGNDLIDHLMVLILPDDDHHIIKSIQQFKNICRSRFGITPQDESDPALMWGAIFKGSKALFYQYEKGGEIRSLIDPDVVDGPYSIEDHYVKCLGKNWKDTKILIGLTAQHHRVHRE
ncbi:unnamed protein product [Aspergillus oryzae RIB40]|uniref:DNA, SC038 n=1 Tax=Aspergillus oryzae (strain ATCC 42149 / RIB 40) TaxID=510516 RepID=Q2U2G1_ASPOR|nr:unnamed protein product [Aspergillus oryzae RIB40]BAE64254.1 unnamed protein product [Aspergillus oryzae RIB40]